MSTVQKDATDVSRYIVLRDSSDGTPETGYTITNLDLQYVRAGAAPAAKVDATALGSTDAAHADNKAIEIDGTSSPGLYRVDWPDAAFATGVDKVILTVSGTGLDPAVEEVQLVNYSAEFTDIKSRLPAALVSGRMASDVEAINDAAAAAVRLALSAGQIIPGTVDTDTNTHTPTTTEFQADDITTAAADHYNGRIVIFTSGTLAGQATSISDYVIVGGIAQFTVVALTSAPVNDGTFIIL